MILHKADKFVELANKRVNRAINYLKSIGKLSNKNNYIYTDDQVKKIINVLQKEIDSIKQNFQNAGNVGTDVFKL